MFQVTEYDGDNFGSGRWSFYAPTASRATLGKWYTLDTSALDALQGRLKTHTQFWFLADDGALVHLKLSSSAP